MSLARQSYLRKSAAVGTTTAEASPIYANAYELQLIALANAKRALKQVQSFERKMEIKKRVLPDFQSWVTGVLDGDKGGQDAVMMTCMVWDIDIGDYTQATNIAAYAIKHGLTMPDDYQRDVATFITEEMATQALDKISANKPEQVDVDSLAKVAALTEECDMPDEVRAKMHKALGLARMASAELDSETPNRLLVEQAHANLTRALELHPKAGVKKDIARLQRLLQA